jgi:hypothetical protein
MIRVVLDTNILVSALLQPIAAHPLDSAQGRLSQRTQGWGGLSCGHVGDIIQRKTHSPKLRVIEILWWEIVL